MILHHYPNSPFAEKIRALFGYKGMPWQSVIAPDIMPKPDLQALTGGYRRIPVLQVGADIYCDTALMVKVIEAAQPLPALLAHPQQGLVESVAQWADDALFWAAMGYNAKGFAALFASLPPEEAQRKGKAFTEDRTAMMGNMARVRPGDAVGIYTQYLTRLEHSLAAGPYLFGARLTVADLSCYHPLWFTLTRVPQLATIFEPFPAVSAWLKRLQVLSEQGRHLATPMSSTDAINLAASSTPIDMSHAVFHNTHGIALGSPVAIMAEKFGAEVTEGELVAATESAITLRRVDARAGHVQVHFPRAGFVLKAA
jgi:glutathione S-transferase